MPTGPAGPCASQPCTRASSAPTSSTASSPPPRWSARSSDVLSTVVRHKDFDLSSERDVDENRCSAAGGTLECHLAERLDAVDQTGQSRALTISGGSADSVVSNLEVKGATRGVRAHFDN